MIVTTVGLRVLVLLYRNEYTLAVWILSDRPPLCDASNPVLQWVWGERDSLVATMAVVDEEHARALHPCGGCGNVAGDLEAEFTGAEGGCFVRRRITDTNISSAAMSMFACGCVRRAPCDGCSVSCDG